MFFNIVLCISSILELGIQPQGLLYAVQNDIVTTLGRKYGKDNLRWQNLRWQTTNRYFPGAFLTPAGLSESKCSDITQALP